MASVPPLKLALEPMKSTMVLVIYALVCVAEGALMLSAKHAPHQSREMLMQAQIVANALMIFLWFRADAREVGYQRSGVLNVAVVALAFLAIPVYLVRSRPKGRRLKALGWFGVVVCGTVLCVVTGALGFALVSGSHGL